MGLDLDNVDGQTPLDENEKEVLLSPTIATRGELDEFEQQNIEQAVLWTLSRSFKADAVFLLENVLITRKQARYALYSGLFKLPAQSLNSIGARGAYQGN
jgi:hypothetical protein